MGLTALCVCFLTDTGFILNLLNLLKQNIILFAPVLLTATLLFLNIKN